MEINSPPRYARITIGLTDKHWRGGALRALSGWVRRGCCGDSRSPEAIRLTRRGPDSSLLQGSATVTVTPEKYQQATYAWDQINVYTRVNKSRFSFGKSQPKERKHILKDGKSACWTYSRDTCMSRTPMTEHSVSVSFLI